MEKAPRLERAAAGRRTAARPRARLTVSVPAERAASPADGRLAEDPVVEAPLADTDRQGLTEEQRAALEGVRDLEVSPELREIIGRAMKAAFVREERR